MDYSKKGFTIVELMIAISIFATAMTLVLAGVILVSRQYQHASNKVALEDVSRSIHQQISQSLRFSSVVNGPNLLGGKMVFCVGKDKYVYGQTPIINSASFTAQTEGLYMGDNTDNCGSNAFPTGSRNLLPDEAKVAYFNFDSSTDTLTTIFIKAPSDGGDLVKVVSNPVEAGCDGTKFGREYCASTKFISTATGRIK